jgi:uncharacterized membrane protein
MIAWLALEAASLPDWSLSAAGLIKGIYPFGAYVPGTTIILLYFLAHECSIYHTPVSVFFVWAGVLLGLTGSYGIGRAVSRTGLIDRSTWKDYLFAVHPALAAMHFFELGYWRKQMFRQLAIFAIIGLILLAGFVWTICMSKGLLTGLTGEIAPVWAIILITLGLWRLGAAFFAGK